MADKKTKAHALEDEDFFFLFLFLTAMKSALPCVKQFPNFAHGSNPMPNFLIAGLVC